MPAGKGIGDIVELQPNPITLSGLERRRMLVRVTVREIEHAVGHARRGAAFVDIAQAWRQAGGQLRGPLVIDTGVGMRVRLPGRDDVLRVDYGYGLRDGANAISVGWQR